MTDRDSKFDDLALFVMAIRTSASQLAPLSLVNSLWAEVELWKERWEAERRDHEATITHCDKMLNEGPRP